MARFITMDGVEKFVTPQNNKKFTLKEAQKYVGGYVEVVYLNDNIICLCNEEGLLNGLQVNQMATVAMQLCGWQGGPIVGNVIICKEDEF